MLDSLSCDFSAESGFSSASENYVLSVVIVTISRCEIMKARIYSSLALTYHQGQVCINVVFVVLLLLLFLLLLLLSLWTTRMTPVIIVAYQPYECKSLYSDLRTTSKKKNATFINALRCCWNGTQIRTKYGIPLPSAFLHQVVSLVKCYEQW